MLSHDEPVLETSCLTGVLSCASPDVTPQIARVLEMITDAFVALDAHDRCLHVNGEAERLLGRSRSELLGNSVWAILPVQTSSACRQSAERARAEGIPVTCESFAPTLGCWLESRLFPAPDGLLFVYFRDITETKHAQDALCDLNAELSRKVEEFQTLFDLLPVAVLVSSDVVCSHIRANPAGQRLLSVPPEASICLSAGDGRKTSAFRVLREGREVPPQELPMQIAAATGREVPEAEYQIVRSDGSRVMVYAYSAPLYDEHGQTRGSIGAFIDATGHKQAEQKLQEYNTVLQFQKKQLEEINAKLGALATTDGLTGLTNHRAFHERLAEEVARAARYGQQPLSLILLDVDYFKAYNDTFGHPAGDQVLRRMGQLLQSMARESDIVARYGGEEFALALPQTDAVGALAIAERVCIGVEAAEWHKRPVTASLGVSTLGFGMDGGDLIACADAALYRAKAGGRNRVAYE